MFNTLAAQVNSQYKPFSKTSEIRAEIAAVVPMYQGIEKLAQKGDQFQIAGRHLCAGGIFKTPDSRGRFSLVSSHDSSIPAGFFRLSTRRGKQFNSMVHEQKDSINGATRDAVLLNPADAQKLGVQHGTQVRLTSSAGTMLARVCISNVKPSNVQVHFPEGNVLLDKHKRSDQSHIPDYNALVKIEAV